MKVDGFRFVSFVMGLGNFLISNSELNGSISMRYGDLSVESHTFLLPFLFNLKFQNAFRVLVAKIFRAKFQPSHLAN